MQEEARIALFIDFENIALGLRGKKARRFDVHLILERLLEKGRIIAKRAYADWTRYSEFRRDLHEAAIELIEVPTRQQTGKNSADIRLVVDALDLCYTKEHLDTFVVVSGDSDFSPLVSKLKENNKRVIGLGLREATSNLLADNCDEFLFYEDLIRSAAKAVPRRRTSPSKKQEAFDLLLDAIEALLRENKESPLELDDQGHDQAEEADIQRERLRLPDLQRTAGGCGRHGVDRDHARHAVGRHLCGHGGPFRVKWTVRAFQDRGRS